MNLRRCKLHSRWGGSFLFVLLCVLLCASFSFAGGEWRQLAAPSAQRLSKSSFVDSANGWIVGARGLILATTNGGSTWQAQNSGLQTDIHAIHMLDKRFGWALTFHEYVDTVTWYGTRILRTTNGGGTWTNRKYPDSGEFFSGITFLDSLNGWIGGLFGRFVRTTNGGEDWIPVQVDSSIHAQWEITNIQFLTPRLAFAMGGRFDIIGVIWRSTDGGLRWTPQAVSPEPVYGMHLIDSVNIVGIAGDVDYGASMIRTKNGGLQWDYTYLNIFGEPRSLSFRTDGEAWVPLGFAGQLMYTQDTASTWSVIDVPKRRAINHLAFTDSLTGYAVGDSGMILKYTPTPVRVRENSIVMPTSIELNQNYPNPFNPSTTISFALNQASIVSITVFTLLGEEVRTVFVGRKEAGHHLVRFTAGDLPSGVYLYRMETEFSTVVKKMLLLK